MRFQRVLPLVLLALLSLPVAGQGPAPRDSGLILSSVSQAITAPMPEIGEMSLIVDLSARTLFVMDGRTIVRRYPVAVGASDYPTPRGEFRIARLIWNPSWTPPRSGWARNRRPERPGSPGNPMGRVKIFFQEPDYYLHGTGHASSLGRPASHGCVRLRNADATEVARLLMENGGAARDEAWFRDVLENSGTSRPVRLARPVTLRVRA